MSKSGKRLIGAVKEIPLIELSNHYWEYCDHCDRNVVICSTCGNNTCNGGHGEIEGMPCPDCLSAYSIYLEGGEIKND